MDNYKATLYMIEKIINAHPQVKDNHLWNIACIDSGVSDFLNSKEYKDDKIYICKANHSQALYVKMLVPHKNPVIIIEGNGNVLRWHGEYIHVLPHLEQVLLKELGFVPPSFALNLMKEYKKSLHIHYKELLQKEEFPESVVRVLDDEQVEIVYNDNHYYMLDSNKELIILGSVDNHEPLATIDKDITTYPDVMRVLRHIEEKDYIWKFYETNETYQSFMKQMCYVLSFVYLEVRGVRIHLRDLFPIEL